MSVLTVISISELIWGQGFVPELVDAGEISKKDFPKATVWRNGDTYQVDNMCEWTLPHPHVFTPVAGGEWACVELNQFNARMAERASYHANHSDRTMYVMVRRMTYIPACGHRSSTSDTLELEYEWFSDGCESSEYYRLVVGKTPRGNVARATRFPAT